MTELSAARAMSVAMTGLMTDRGTGDVLATLVGHCADLYPAAAVAIMVVDREGRLEPLSATSHRALELEALQAQEGDGPCNEALRTDDTVTSVGVQDMVSRWGAVGGAVEAAGFRSVHAYPMRWHGRPLGGLNIFLSREVLPGEEALVLGQLFADVATLVILRAQVAPSEVAVRVHEALTARAVIEQAKGVLAFERDVDMATAYTQLLADARDQCLSLDEMADKVVRGAHG